MSVAVLERKGKFIPRRVEVVFREGVSYDDALRIVRHSHARVEYGDFSGSKKLILTTAEGEEEKVIKALAGDPRVVRATRGASHRDIKRRQLSRCAYGTSDDR